VTTPNPYRTLGIRKDATDAQIRKAYHAKAKKFHPDHNPGTETVSKFQAVEEAYRVLSDSARRAKYDATGEIDDVKADRSIADLMQVLAPCMLGTIQSIVNGGRKLQNENVVEHMRTALKNAITELSKRRKEATKMVGELALTIERFTTAEGEENLLAGAARTYLAQIEGQAKAIDAEVAKIEWAAEYLRKCGYRCENALEMIGGYGSSTASVSWRFT